MMVLSLSSIVLKIPKSGQRRYISLERILGAITSEKLAVPLGIVIWTVQKSAVRLFVRLDYHRCGQATLSVLV